MDANISTWVVIAIATVGAIAWLAGLSVMARATRAAVADEEAAARFAIEDPASGTIVGAADVEGRPEELSEKLARLLARDGMGPLGPVKIVACDHTELIFEPAGAGAAAPAEANRGRFRFTPKGSLTHIEYAIEARSGRVLIALGWLFVGLGLAALAGGCWAMFSFVLPSPNPNVRGQAIQMVQVVHFLWPPFLFAALARRPARWITARIDALVNNLPYS